MSKSTKTTGYNENGKIENEKYHNEAGELHNPAGPAWRVWSSDGNLLHESYWLDGNLHNPAGPALRELDSAGNLICEEFWFAGKKLTAAEFDAKLEVEK